MLWERRAPPWEAGWLLHPLGDPPVSTRSRGDWQGEPIPSTFYLHPRHLMCRRTHGPPHDPPNVLRWDLMDLAAACRQLEVLLSAPAAAARFPLALDGLRAIRDDQDRDPEREPAAATPFAAHGRHALASSFANIPALHGSQRLRSVLLT